MYQGDGDPSQDVAHASVLFLVDANLVLLQSSTTENDPKYDMRVIAHNVEYFDLMRDQGSLLVSPSQSVPESPSSEVAPMTAFGADCGLRDSLWYFDGTSIQCWLDVKDLLTPTSIGNHGDFPQPVTIQTDFYPTAVVMDRGVVLGLDTELMQRGDMHFAMIRHTTRVCRIHKYLICIADSCRRSYSFLTSYRKIYPRVTLLPLLSWRYATKIFHTSRMHSKSFYIWFLMTR